MMEKIKRSRKAGSKRTVSNSEADGLSLIVPASPTQSSSGLDSYLISPVKNVAPKNQHTDELLEDTPSTTTETTERSAKSTKTNGSLVTVKVDNYKRGRGLINNFATKPNTKFLQEKSSIFMATKAVFYGETGDGSPEEFHEESAPDMSALSSAGGATSSTTASAVTTKRRGSAPRRPKRRSSTHSSSSLSTNQWEQNTDEWSHWGDATNPHQVDALEAGGSVGGGSFDASACFVARKPNGQEFAKFASQTEDGSINSAYLVDEASRGGSRGFGSSGFGSSGFGSSNGSSTPPFIDASPLSHPSAKSSDFFVDEDNMSMLSDLDELQDLSGVMDRMFESQKRNSTNVQHVLLVEYIMAAGIDRETAENLSTIWMSEQPTVNDGQSPSAMALISKLHEAERGGRPQQVSPNTRRTYASKTGAKRNSSLIPPSQLADASRHALPSIKEGTQADEEVYDAECAYSIILPRRQDASKSTRKRWCSIPRIAIFGCLIVAAIGTGAAVFFILQGNVKTPSSSSSGDNEASTPAPSSAPTFISQEILEAAIQYSGEDVFDQYDSPQLRAVGWLSSVDMFDTGGLGQEAFAQRYAMATMYFSLKGEQWLNQEKWMSPLQHECDWSIGITCGNDLGGAHVTTNALVVKGLDMTRNSLRGSFPAEIRLLVSLETLKASKNIIVGPIPSTIGDLPKLQELDLSSNRLAGSIPATIADDGNLVELDLSYNELEGTLPEGLYNLSFLRTLALTSNKLSGPISESMYNLQTLVTFDVRNNTFTGEIPLELSKIPNLDVFRVDYNQLTGQLPVLKGSVSATHIITLSHNKIEGQIQIDPTYLLSSEAADFEFRLQHIDISYNRLNGPVSPLIGFIPSVRHVDISGNMLTGTFPSVVQWKEIEFLAAASNLLTGTLPVGLPTLTHLDMSFNEFSEALPQDYCDFTRLQFLAVTDNKLDGDIPPCVGQLPALRDLALNHNLLDGTIPTELGQLSRLGTLNLSMNRLVGPIPSELGKVIPLRHVRLNNNQLSGSIPSQLGGLTDLKTLRLENNLLSGIFPSELGALQKLDSLYLKHNSVGGEIPEGLCKATLNLLAKDIGCDIDCPCCADATDVCGGSN